MSPRWARGWRRKTRRREPSSGIWVKDRKQKTKEFFYAPEFLQLVMLQMMKITMLMVGYSDDNDGTIQGGLGQTDSWAKGRAGLWGLAGIHAIIIIVSVIIIITFIIIIVCIIYYQVIVLKASRTEDAGSSEGPLGGWCWCWWYWWWRWQWGFWLIG